MNSFITTALFLITILYNVSCSATQLYLQQKISSLETGNNLFANRLFLNIAAGKSKENILVSPASVHAALAFMYLGAEGNTADEIRTVLNLPQESKESFASKYGEFLKTTFNKTNADDDALQLKMANRLYVNDNIKIAPSFNKIFRKNFDFVAKSVDFNQAEKVVDEINKWVLQMTNNKIKDIIESKDISSQTSAVLLNTIYLNAKWLYPFNKDETFKTLFYTSEHKTVKVDFMNREADLRYGELKDINAKAIALPYNNSDISMLIILPNYGSDLEKLEENLMGKDLNYITSQMVDRKVDVYLPKFRIEYDIDLKEPLKQLGITSMFKQNINLNGIFDSDIPQSISSVKQKTYLECEEGGIEAAGSTAGTYELLSAGRNKRFFANRPFAFFVRSNTTVLFAGHVATLS